VRGCDRVTLGLSIGSTVSFDFKYLGISASGSSLNSPLKREVRGARAVLGEETLSLPGTENGSALSFALRLRKRNSGISQTHIPKKDVVSQKL